MSRLLMKIVAATNVTIIHGRSMSSFITMMFDNGMSRLLKRSAALVAVHYNVTPILEKVSFPRIAKKIQDRTYYRLSINSRFLFGCDVLPVSLRNINTTRLKHYSLIFFVLLGMSANAQTPNSATASDTVLSFQEAKARLVTSNLSLLASYYEINIAQAKVIQAKVWNNPYFIVNGDLYNTEANEYFHVRNQNLFQVEQTFSFAGKHTNNVKLARIGVEMAEKQLEDVIRSLHFELGNTYSSLASLQEKAKLYTQVITNYERLMQATRKQLEVGTISLTEALRLESEYLAVKADALAIANEKERTMANLRILLRLPQDTTFYVEQKLPLIGEEFDALSLQEQAVTIRPDIQAAKINIRFQERNLRLQRSSGIPDLKIGYQPRDRGSNYTRPYQGFTSEIFLPLFDRNQGKIKQAEHSIGQATLQFEEMDNRIRNEVAAAYNRYKNSNTGLVNYQDDFLEKLRELNRNNNENFQKRNIGLLQFIDQQRIFIQTNIQLIELRQQHLNNVNELNFTIGTNLIEY